MAAHLGTYSMLSSPTTGTTGDRVTGERDAIPVEAVPVTDRLRVFLQTVATLPKASAVTRKALNEIVRKPNETVAAVAGRLIDAFCAATGGRNRPHAGEMSSFFWR